MKRIVGVYLFMDDSVDILFTRKKGMDFSLPIQHQTKPFTLKTFVFFK